MQFLRNITALLGLIGLSTIDTRFADIFKKICEACAEQYSIGTIIYIRHENAAYNAFRNSEHSLDVPSILQTLHTKDPIAIINIYENMSVKNYSKKFNRNLGSIVQLTQNAKRDEELLQTLWQRLHWNRQSFLILLFDDGVNENYVKKILKFCAKEKAINVIGLQPYMTLIERSYWTLRLFPNVTVIKQFFTQRYHNIYFNQLENLKGYPFRILGGKTSPEFYNYTSNSGATVLSGYIAKTINEYARRLNATLENEFEINASIISLGRATYLESYNADIGLFNSIALEDGKLPFTVFINNYNWCLMIPMERPIPKFSYYFVMMYKSFVMLFCSSVIIISCIWAFILRWKGLQHVKFMDYIVNVYVIQVLLGTAAFCQQKIVAAQKFISMIISFAGIVIGTAYVAYLQSFTVDAPTETEAETVDDLLKRGIKIALLGVFKDLIKNDEIYSKYFHNITFMDNYTELYLLRDNFDTDYAFIGTNMWTLLEEQQKYFSKPLFRSSELCFIKEDHMVFPLPENSIYHQHLNYFILKLQEAGLIDHWRHHSFIELLEMDVISLEDRNKQPGFVPLQLKDLQMMFIGLCLMWALCIFCFVLEHFWYTFQKDRLTTTKLKGSNRKINRKYWFSRPKFTFKRSA